MTTTCTCSSGTLGFRVHRPGCPLAPSLESLLRDAYDTATALGRDDLAEGIAALVEPEEPCCLGYVTSGGDDRCHEPDCTER